MIVVTKTVRVESPAAGGGCYCLPISPSTQFIARTARKKLIDRWINCGSEFMVEVNDSEKHESQE